jgi:hypothetical protein
MRYENCTTSSDKEPMRSLLLCVALLTGCGSYSRQTTIVATNPPPHSLQPRPPNEVAIVSTPPPRPFIEVGLVDGHPPSAEENEPASILASMRSAAGRHGCDALMITGANNIVHGSQYFTWTDLGYHGACLVFTDAAKPPPK